MRTTDTDRAPAEELLCVLAGVAGEAAGWRDRARCAEVDPELFFPEKGGSVAAPKRVCRTCEVREDCLQDALERGEQFGVWGGLSERERRVLARETAAARSAERLPSCPVHGGQLSGGPVVWHCPAGQLGHRVSAADIEEAAEAARGRVA